MDSARPKELEAEHFWVLHPTLKGQSCDFRNLESDGLTCLALDHRDAFLDASCREDIPNAETDEITAAQLAVDSHVEQGEIARIACHLEADSSGPDMPGQKWALLADDAASVPSRVGGA